MRMFPGVLVDDADDTHRYGSVVRQLADILKQAETPVTIGLEGEYGSGKTSFLAQLLVQEGFEKPEIEQLLAGAVPIISRGKLRVMYFNGAVWGPEADLLSAWIASLLDACRSIGGLADLVTKAATVAAYPFLLLGNIASAFGTGGRSIPELEHAAWTSVQSGLAAAADAAQAKRSVSRAVRDLLCQVRPGTDEDAAKAPTLILLLDNLDRAMPSQCFRFLTALQSLADLPSGVVTIIALDYLQLVRWIRSELRLPNPDMLLRKLFNIRFGMPHPRLSFARDTVAQYVRLYLPKEVGRACGLGSDSELETFASSAAALCRSMKVDNPRMLHAVLAKFCLLSQSVWGSVNATGEAVRVREWVGTDATRGSVFLMTHLLFCAIHDRFSESYAELRRATKLRFSHQSNFIRDIENWSRQVPAEVASELFTLGTVVLQYWNAFRLLWEDRPTDSGHYPHLWELDEKQTHELQGEFFGDCSGRLTTWTQYVGLYMQLS